MTRYHRLASVCFVAFIAAAMTFSFMQPGIASEALGVADIAWSTGISEKDPAVRITEAKTGSTLIFWTRIRGTAAVMKELREHGRLPIYHRWIRYIGPQAEPHGSVITDDIVTEIGHPGRHDALQTELFGRGYFDWRVWSEKRNLSPGTWAVRMVYANGEPITCRQASGTLSACEFRIAVTRGGRP